MNDPHGKYIDGFDARHSSNGDGPIKVGDWLAVPNRKPVVKPIPTASYHEPPVDEHEHNRVICPLLETSTGSRRRSIRCGEKKQFFQRIAASANYPFPPEPSVAEIAGKQQTRCVRRSSG